MVVISAAICTRAGKPLVARQFVEITRLRLESLLSSFPKLISPAKQHTYVENESARFVFQSMDGLYLVLITTKNSNIVEDLDTLRLLSKVVSEACPNPTEESIHEAAFHLVTSFDEVLSLGYRESITLQGIRTNLEMNSHEEKLSQMIRQSKESEAKLEMKRQAEKLQQKKINVPSSNSSMGGGGGRPTSGSMQGFGPSSSTNLPSSVGTTTGKDTKTTTPTGTGTAAPTGKKPGLQLGKKKKEESVLEAMAAEDGIDSEALKEATAPSSLSVPGAVTVPKDPVTVSITEAVSCTLKQDGSLASYEVSGQVSIVCRQEEMKCTMHMVRDDSLAEGFTFKTHPQIDKTMWEKNGILVNKAKDRPFSANTPFGALKYRSKPVTDVGHIPLSVTVWPELASGGKATNVNVEYELQNDAIDLYNVTFVIPLNSQAEPQVLNVEGGVHRHNSRRQQLEWTIDVISATTSKTGSLEFNLPLNAASKTVDGSGFFPTIVTFTSNKSLAGLNVNKVEVEGMPDCRFGVEIELKTETYEVIMEE
jgi:hypothetical protein